MTYSTNRSVFRAAGAAALALALGLTLSACGRKGPLDAPPGASIYGNASEPQRLDANGRPIAPDGPNRRLPIDVLLD